MPALSQVPAWFYTEYSTNWNHRVQQAISRLKDRVTMTTVNGRERVFNRFGSQEMNDKTGRAARTMNQDVTLDARWLRMKSREVSNLLDEEDQKYLGPIALPTSEIMSSQLMAYLRKIDSVIIDAFGTVYSGDDGSTAVPLPSGQLVPVNFVAPATTGPNSNLTLDKIIAARSKFGLNDVDEDEELIWIYSQNQLDSLLRNVTQVKSSDYVNVKALVDGVITKFMGFTWVRSQRLPLVSNVRTNFAYAKSAILFAENGRETHMDILPDWSHALQIRSVAGMGATRLHDEKAVAIYCDETVS